MRKQARHAAGVLVALSGVVPNLFIVNDAAGQMTTNEVLNMSANIINPLAVVPSVSINLNFGKFGIAGTGSYIVKATSNGINGGFTISGNNAGTGKISAPQDATFTLSIPTHKVGSDIILNHSGGGGAASKEITVESLYFANKNGLSNISGTIKIGSHALSVVKVTNPAETGRFYMGARLLFGVNQLLGTYTGQFTLRVTL